MLIDISYSLFTPDLSAFNLGEPTRKLLYSKETGDSCNCEKIEFVPHVHCTHTETIHHVREELSFTSAQVIQSIPLTQRCVVINLSELINAKLNEEATAVIVKYGLSLPYSTNPPHFNSSDMVLILEKFPNASNLLSDLPSLDRKDDAKMPCHNLFFDRHPRGTVTEMCNLSEVISGVYKLNMVPIIILGGDAHPCRPVLECN